MLDASPYNIHSFIQTTDSRAPIFVRPGLLLDPMAKKTMVALVVLVMMVMAEAACPAIELDPCIPAAEADVEPTAECCTNLNTYISEGIDPSCLCEAAIGTAYFTDNPVDYAILIPQKCDLKYAAGTECEGIVIPGGQ